MLLGLTLCSCNREELAPEYGNDTMQTLSVGLACIQTKTWLDYANKETGQSIKVYWSDGDQINVNGQSSLPLKVEPDTKLAQAKFQLPALQAPCRVIYPNSVVTETKYDSNGEIGISLPQTQPYMASTFAQGIAVMYGYSDQTENLKLKNLCAVVRVNITGNESIKIKEAKLVSTSADAPLCGKFRLNPQTGALSAVTGECVNEITLSFEEISLGENGRDFFFAIPAGEYPELVCYFTRADGMQMQNIWEREPDSPLEGGVIYSFNKVEYTPTAKPIETVDEWNEFASAMNAGQEHRFLYKDGSVRLGADIIGTDDVQPMSITSNFTHLLDGNGYSIHQDAATCALFSELSGELRNLTLSGNLDLTANGAPFVNTLRAGGKITRCTNNMEVTFDIKDSTTYVAGFAAILAGTQGEGTSVSEITGCTNNGSITGKTDYKNEKGYEVSIGGIIGDVLAYENHQMNEPLASPYSVQLTDCMNNGDIKFTPIPPDDAETTGSQLKDGMGINGMGGVVGAINKYMKISFKNCDNSGNITMSAERTVNKNGMKGFSICMGGVLGCGTTTYDRGVTVNGHDISLVDCDNSGLLYNCGDNYSRSTENANKVFTGGLAGALVGLDNKLAIVKSCTNVGDIITYDLCTDDVPKPTLVSTRPGYNAVAGGLIGFGGYIDMDDCSVNCKIGNGKRQMVAWGGVFGYIVRRFNLNNTSLTYSGYFQRISTYKMNRAVVGVYPTKTNDLEVDLGNSKITGFLNCSGVLYTTGKYPAYTVTDNLNNNATYKPTTSKFNTTSDVNAKNSIVYGQELEGKQFDYVDYSGAEISYK